MIDRDKVTLETAATRRQRLLSSITFGQLPDRRPARTNMGRFIGSAILAALAGAGCLGTSFVVGTLQKQDIAKTQTDYATVLRTATKLPAGAKTDGNGRPIDPATGWVSGPFGTWYDPLTGWQVNTTDKLLIDPATNWEVDPRTGRAVHKAHLP